MTIKYDNLVEFMAYIKGNGYRTEISRTYLNFFIANRFGASKYVKDNICKMLVDFGFLEIMGVGIFKVCDPWKPKGVK